MAIKNTHSNSITHSIYRRAVRDAFLKLNPLWMARNPVMFVVELGSLLTTLIWSGVVSFILYKLVGAVMGLRVTEEEEREGLDLTSHGEMASPS